MDIIYAPGLQDMQDYGLSELDKLNTPAETLLRFISLTVEKPAGIYLLDTGATGDGPAPPDAGFPRESSTGKSMCRPPGIVLTADDMADLG